MSCEDVYVPGRDQGRDCGGWGGGGEGGCETAVRREESPLGQQDCNVHLAVCCNLAELLGELIVLWLAQGVELLLIVNGDGGDAPLIIDLDYGVCGHFGSGYTQYCVVVSAIWGLYNHVDRKTKTICK